MSTSLSTFPRHRWPAESTLSLGAFPPRTRSTTDRYIAFANSPVGRRPVGVVSLPFPLRLERWQADRIRSVDGPLVIGEGGALAEAMLPFAGKLTDTVLVAVEGRLKLPRWTAEHNLWARAVLFDASGLTRFEQLVVLRGSFQLVLRSLDRCPRMVVLGRAPESLKDPATVSVQRSLEGSTRSLGKGIRHGGNVQLLYVGKGAEDQLEGALCFFLSPKGAYVSGQMVHLAANSVQIHDWGKPLTSQRMLVTGAVRGIGMTIAETLARDGAEVVLLDVPPARETLEGLAACLGGRVAALGICVTDTEQQLVDTLSEGVDIIVHNTRIARNKTLAEVSSDLRNSVINANLNAPQMLTQAPSDDGKLHNNGRVVLLALANSVADNLGQSNYAANKASPIDLIQAWAPTLGKRGITIDAMVPGFIETQMTVAIPLTIHEAGRRMNSTSQGDLPQDVAETMAWLAQPSFGAASGQVLRVHGQGLLGA